MQNIRGKTALITGASRGIGKRIAAALAQDGMDLVLSARSVSALEETAEAARAVGARVTSIAADIEDPRNVKSLAEQAEAESDGIAVLVNNAAIERAMRFEEVDPNFIETMIKVNLTAPLLLTRAILPHMIRRGEGHIVNVSSLAGLVATPYDDTYAATKHGLVGFSRSLRLTLRSEGHQIGVSVICPAFVEGDGMYQAASTASGGTAPFAIGTVPMQRVVRAVVRAIKRDDAEVVLTSKPMLPFLMTQTISPRLAARMSAMVGVPAMFEQWAELPIDANGPVTPSIDAG
jgi:short-subunit dehydrogenase